VSLIDQALKAAQREKTRLDAESGRPVPPVLVRLRAQPRQGIERNHLLFASGAVVTIIAATLWLKSTREAPLPNVPPVTSTILTEAIASDSVRLQGSAPATRSQLPTDSLRVASALSRALDAPVVERAVYPQDVEATEPVVERAPAPEETDPAFEASSRGEERVAPEPPGTLRISVERPRNTSSGQLFVEAVAAHRAMDFPRAKSLYERVLALSPSDGDALNNLGVILSTERDFDRAHALLRRAVTVAPRNAGAWNNIGNLLREQGKSDDAIAAFRQALAIDPRHQGARVGLAQQYLTTNALPQARELLEEVLVTNPALPEAHYTLGQVLELQGDRAGAVASYSAFVRFAPQRLAAHVELVRRRVELLSAAGQ
jgi:Tfp pilus assembly protein PilF